MWSSGAFVDDDETLATELILESGRQRFERTPVRQACRATVLLDMGFTIAVQESSVTQFWDRRFRDYGEGVITALETSLNGDVMAREYFLNERWVAVLHVG